MGNPHSDERQRRVVSEIVQTVSAVTGVPPLAMYSHRRPPKFCYARMLVYYLSVNRFYLSTPFVGKCMDRDHTTILYGVKKIEEATSPDILRDLEILNGVLDRLELEVRFGSN